MAKDDLSAHEIARLLAYIPPGKLPALAATIGQLLFEQVAAIATGETNGCPRHAERLEITQTYAI